MEAYSCIYDCADCTLCLPVQQEMPCLQTAVSRVFVHNPSWWYALSDWASWLNFIWNLRCEQRCIALMNGLSADEYLRLLVF